MLFSPSDLPWWGWLLCSVGAWFVCMIAGAIGNSQKQGCLAGFVALVSGLIGAITGLISVILFVKWVWAS
jgi:hypothetical protein